MPQTPTPPSPHPLSHSSHWAAFSVLVRHGGVEIVPHPRDLNPSPPLGNIPASVSHRARIARPIVRRGWLERGLGTDRGRGHDAYGAELLTKKGVFGIPVGHQNRHVAIDPKTGGLFVGVGSAGNLGVEPEPKATIQRFDPGGSNQTTVASGTRNPTVADDTGGTIWRISYKGPPAEHAGGPAETTGSGARKR